MARAVTYTCDGCGAVKGTTNHWFSAYGYAINAGAGDRGRITTLISGSEGFAVVPFDEAKDNHFCGEQCVLKAVAAALPGLIGK